MNKKRADINHQLTCAIGRLAAIQIDDGIDCADVIDWLTGVRSDVDSALGQAAGQRSRLLNAIAVLSTDTDAVVDSVWMPGGHCTVVEALAEIASQLGAADADIEAAAIGTVFL